MVGMSKLGAVPTANSQQPFIAPTTIAKFPMQNPHSAENVSYFGLLA